MRLVVTVNNETLVFEQAQDGWFENKQRNLAIDPDKTVCVTSPWYADYVSEPPQHVFEIVRTDKFGKEQPLATKFEVPEGDHTDSSVIRDDSDVVRDANQAAQQSRRNQGHDLISSVCRSFLCYVDQRIGEATEQGKRYAYAYVTSDYDLINQHETARVHIAATLAQRGYTAKFMPYPETNLRRWIIQIEW